MPYKFNYSKVNNDNDNNNSGGNDMPMPTWNNNTKFFSLINKELLRYMGQTNFVSKHVPQISVNVSRGAIGADLDNTAYNLKNMYGGTALGHVFNEYGTYKTREFAMKPEEFYIGIDINRIEELNEIYQQDEKRAGEEIVRYIAQKLANRLGLLRERNLAQVITNADYYGTSNTADLTAKAINEWTEADIDNFFSTFLELTKYLNYATGGMLFNEELERQGENKNFFIVVPFDIYTQMQGIFRNFASYITTQGWLEGSKYKAFQPDLFNAITGGKTVVGTAFKVKDDKELNGEYQIENLEDIWTGDNIYMFTTSSNMTDMASVKEVVFTDNDMRNIDILGNNLWRTRTKRQTLASNPYAFAQIKLKTTV